MEMKNCFRASTKIQGKERETQLLNFTSRNWNQENVCIDENGPFPSIEIITVASLFFKHSPMHSRVEYWLLI